MSNFQLKQRIACEKEIFSRVVDVALAAGYWLRVHNGEDWDTTLTQDKAELVKEYNNCDEARLYFLKADKKQSTTQDALDNGNVYCGWVYFVYGNDGPDVISDYTVNLEDLLKPVNDYCDTLDAP